MQEERAWYQNAWVMVGAGYVFPPLGMYLMWRYRSWAPWVKVGITVGGSLAAVVSAYVSGRYVWPHVL